MKKLLLVAAIGGLALVGACNKSAKNDASMGAVAGNKSSASCCQSGDKAACKDMANCKGDKASCSDADKAACKAAATSGSTSK